MNGKEIEIHNIEDAIKNKIAYVPEDRLTQGLFLDRSIQDNMVAASIGKYFHGGKLDHKKIAEDTTEWIGNLSVKIGKQTDAIRTLSGGNAQKVVIAKWLNTDPELIVLNGPTVGVDIGSKSEIFEILHKLAKDGVGVIVISDDLSELVQNCNKILVMRNGKAVAHIDEEISENELYNEFAVISFRVFLCTIALCCVQKACSIFLQSLGKPMLSMSLSLLRDFILSVPLTLILPRYLGVTGALYSGPIADVVSFAAAVFCVRRVFRELRKEETGNGRTAVSGDRVRCVS